MKKADFVKQYINFSGRDIATSLIGKGWAFAGISPDFIFIQRSRGGMKLILPLADRLKPELIEIIGDRIERNQWKPQGKRGGLGGFCYPVQIRLSSSGGYYATSKAFPEMFAQAENGKEIILMARKGLQTATITRNTDKEPLPLGRRYEGQDSEDLFFLMPLYLAEKVEAEAEA